MDSFSTAFARGVAKRINEEIDRLTDGLQTGHAIDNHAEYRNNTGMIRAYRRVLTEFMPETESDLNKA